jgi:hypothetical protein
MAGKHALGDSDQVTQRNLTLNSSDQVVITDTSDVEKANVETLSAQVMKVIIPSSSGASPRSIDVQIQENLSNNVAEVVLLQVGVYQDEYGAATATNATIAVGAAGTQVKVVTSNKELICRTDATGLLTLTLTDGTAETFYVLSKTCPRSRILDCSDIGTIVVS